MRPGLIDRRGVLKTAAIIAAAIAIAILGVSAIGVGSSRVPISPERTESTAVDRAIPSLPRPLEGPITVAIQPGHWKIDELPAEAARRKRVIGAIHDGVYELDINLAVVSALRPLLEAEGYTVHVIPATVPPRLRVDAFISIHADWGGDPERKGWKLAPPWRPSQASSDLAESLKSSFRGESSLREDVGGITYGMRGYFGFSPDRYIHATSPNTPAVIIELGFVTNESDRNTMVSRPGYYAGIIHRGLVGHFSTFDRSDTAKLVPKTFGLYVVGDGGSRAYILPDVSSEVIVSLSAGSIIRPVDENDDWYEVLVRNPFRIGWLAKTDVVPRTR